MGAKGVSSGVSKDGVSALVLGGKDAWLLRRLGQGEMVVERERMFGGAC